MLLECFHIKLSCILWHCFSLFFFFLLHHNDNLEKTCSPWQKKRVLSNCCCEVTCCCPTCTCKWSVKPLNVTVFLAIFISCLLPSFNSNWSWPLTCCFWTVTTTLQCSFLSCCKSLWILTMYVTLSSMSNKLYTLLSTLQACPFVQATCNCVF